jgi:hypothetical protein
VMYKITEARHAEALMRAAQRGVSVRVITEGERYPQSGEHVAGRTTWTGSTWPASRSATARARRVPAPEEHPALRPGDDGLRIVELDERVERLAVRAQLLHQQGVVLRLVQGQLRAQVEQRDGAIERPAPFTAAAARGARSNVSPANAATGRRPPAARRCNGTPGRGAGPPTSTSAPSRHRRSSWRT